MVLGWYGNEASPIPNLSPSPLHVHLPLSSLPVSAKCASNGASLAVAGEFVPMPPQQLMRILSGPPVERVGDGLTMGMSRTMMRFFTLPGPFIGKGGREVEREEEREGGREGHTHTHTHTHTLHTIEHSLNEI